MLPSREEGERNEAMTTLFIITIAFLALLCMDIVYIICKSRAKCYEVKQLPPQKPTISYTSAYIPWNALIKVDTVKSLYPDFCNDSIQTPTETLHDKLVKCFNNVN